VTGHPSIPAKAVTVERTTAYNSKDARIHTHLAPDSRKKLIYTQNVDEIEKKFHASMGSIGVSVLIKQGSQTIHL